MYTSNGAEGKIRIGQGSSRIAHVKVCYFATLIPGRQSLYLNIRPTFKVFFQQVSIMEILQEMFRYQGKEPMSSRVLEQAIKVLKGLTVTAKQTKMSCKIRQVVNSTPRDFQFQTKQGGTTTVAEYFQSAYSLKLKYADSNLIQVEPKKRNIMIPAELLELKEEQEMRTPQQEYSEELIRFSGSLRPQQSKNSISQFRRSVPSFDTMFFEIAKEGQVLFSEILSPPAILYRRLSPNQEAIIPYGGTWKTIDGNRKDMHFLVPAQIQSVAVLCLENQRNFSLGDCNEMLKCLLRMSSKNGIKISRDIRVAFEFANPQSEDDMIHVMNKLQRCRPEIMLTILPGSRRDRPQTYPYSFVKHVCETRLDVMSQCMIAGKVKGARDDYFRNVALKLNTKLDGINHNLKFSHQQIPDMVIGIDQSLEEGQSVVFGVAGSISKDLMRYTAEFAIQDERTHVKGFRDIMKKLLVKRYEHTNGDKPQRIIIFREGDEGSQKTQREEMTAIRQACSDMNPSYSPELIFIVTRTRNVARIYAREEDSDRSGNFKSGTLAAQDVFPPESFILGSQGGIQGTSRPCMYTVLQNDSSSSFPMEALQKFCFDLCHAYASCTRATKVPAALFYASLIAARIRLHLKHVKAPQAQETQNVPVLGQVVSRRMWFT